MTIKVKGTNIVKMIFKSSNLLARVNILGLLYILWADNLGTYSEYIFWFEVVTDRSSVLMFCPN